MSFSSDVKDELAKQINSRRHCMLAELAAIIEMTGRIEKEAAGLYTIKIHTENVTLARKCFTLIKKTFNIITEIEIGTSYLIQVTDGEQALRIVQALKLEDRASAGDEGLVHPLLIQNDCCKRAFIRGAFLASGSMSDPEKFYHFEIVCSTRKKAAQLMEIINSFQIESKIVERKHHFVVYVKEGTQIVDLLNIMEAHVSLMQMENVRILKDMRNNVNRQVNCETANLNKTVSAAVRQMEDIHLIQERGKLEQLPDNLREIAEIRLENPEASLKELGEMLNPPIGKSGVNHRLRKLSEIAESIRSQGGCI